MTSSKLSALLSGFQELNILVVGDFFLDRYLIIDPELAEESLETGLQARQVVQIRNSPGAAGTVTSNLSALGVGRVRALGVIGKDGHGHDLKKELEETNVDTGALIEDDRRFTPTYTKPVSSTSGEELERLDVKNRKVLPREIEDQIISELADLAPDSDGVIVLDQVQEADCGVVTSRVREALTEIALANPKVTFFADSRTLIGQFRHVITKPNAHEAVHAEHPELDTTPDLPLLETCIRSFSKRTSRPVYITLGADGILCDDLESVHHIPGISVPEPIDVVGAGDSASAAIVSALCAGASYVDAGMLGVLVSSITIQQLGTTGTAKPEKIMARLEEIEHGF